MYVHLEHFADAEHLGRCVTGKGQLPPAPRPSDRSKHHCRGLAGVVATIDQLTDDLGVSEVLRSLANHQYQQRP